MVINDTPTARALLNEAGVPYCKGEVAARHLVIHPSTEAAHAEALLRVLHALVAVGLESATVPSNRMYLRRLERYAKENEERTWC